jgi:hypothetical protein
MNFDNLDLETGDILLFNHVNNYNTGFQIFDDVLSWAIRTCTNSIYTHVGIVVKDPNFTIGGKLKGLYLLESNYEGFPDSENNEIKFGVQLVPLEKGVINNYSNIYYRKLKCNRDKSFYQKLDNIHSVIHNKPNDINPVDWIKAAFRVKIGDVIKTNTFWCSALVCYIYINLGLLDDNLPWTIISPEQLSSNGNNHLTFKNCQVETEKLIYSVNTTNEN